MQHLHKVKFKAEMNSVKEITETSRVKGHSRSHCDEYPIKLTNSSLELFSRCVRNDSIPTLAKSRRVVPEGLSSQIETSLSTSTSMISFVGSEVCDAGLSIDNDRSNTIIVGIIND